MLADSRVRLPLFMKPFLWLCLPFMITPRLGPQMELAQTLFSYSMPSFASPVDCLAEWARVCYIGT